MGWPAEISPMRMSVSHWQSVSYETSAGIGLWLRNLGGSSSTQEIWKKKIWKNMQGSAPLWSTFGNWNPINANYRAPGKKTMSSNAETKQRDSVAWHEYAEWEAGWKSWRIQPIKDKKKYQAEVQSSMAQLKSLQYWSSYKTTSDCTFQKMYRYEEKSLLTHTLTHDKNV